MEGRHTHSLASEQPALKKTNKLSSSVKIPGNILASVNNVESLATKQEEKSSAASLLCRWANSRSSSTWNLLVPEMFRVPPAPAPCFWRASLQQKHFCQVSSFFEIQQQRSNQTDGSRDGLGDSGVSAHPQIVVAAPDRNLCLCSGRVRVAVCHWEGEGTAVQRLKDPVCVLALPAFNHLFKEFVVLEGGSCKEMP